MLAADYALAHPDRVHRVVFASACLGMQRTRDDMARLRATLPDGVRRMLDRHEAAGTTESAGYQTAALAFYRRHLCRLEPWPAAMSASQHGIARDVYGSMWGPSELTPTGSLRDYEREDRLAELAMATLFLCGRHDEITPEATAAYAAATPGARFCIFEHSAHVAHLEEPARFFDVVHGFLAEGDA
jgi:proline iminopeptidase